MQSDQNQVLYVWDSLGGSFNFQVSSQVTWRFCKFWGQNLPFIITELGTQQHVVLAIRFYANYRC